jgi:hypothetical protein
MQLARLSGLTSGRERKEMARGGAKGKEGEERRAGVKRLPMGEPE